MYHPDKMKNGTFLHALRLVLLSWGLVLKNTPLLFMIDAFGIPLINRELLTTPHRNSPLYISHSSTTPV